MRRALLLGTVGALVSALGCTGDLSVPDEPQDDLLDAPGGSVALDGGLSEGPAVEIPPAEDAGPDTSDAGAPAPPPPKGPLDDYDATRGKVLADKAMAMWSGKKAGGKCLMGVRMSAEASGIIPTPPGWTRFAGAYQWGEWANSHPADLKKIGFRRVTGLGARGIPRGSIIVWQRSQCGYSKDWGHIEIVTDTASSKACSDYCGSVKTCAEPWTYIPTKL